MSMDDRLPAEPRREGPGAKDWLFGIAVTGLLATCLAFLRDQEGIQTANRYYSQKPGVAEVQFVGFAVDLLIILTIAWWLARPIKRFWPETLLALWSAIGFVACWIELFLALFTLPGAVYRLDDLPFRPVNNWGLLGATVFMTYLVGKSDFSKAFGKKSFWLKTALLVFLFSAQWAAFWTARAKLGVM